MDKALLGKERKLRAHASSKNLKLTKGYRYENWNGSYCDKIIGYMIIDTFTNLIIVGGNEYDGYEFTFDEAEVFINSYVL